MEPKHAVRSRASLRASLLAWASVVCVVILLVAACGPAGIGLLIAGSSGSKTRSTETVVAAAPVLEVTLPDPARNIDPNRTWALLPVTVKVINPNDDRVPPLSVALAASYATSQNASRPMTLVGTVPNIPALAAGGTASVTMLWDVAHDEGLGIALGNDLAGNNGLTVATVTVEATAMAPDVKVSPVLGSATTTLNTNPFVAFRETLVENAERVWSAGVERSNRTRELFLSRIDRAVCVIPQRGRAATNETRRRPLGGSAASRKP